MTAAKKKPFLPQVLTANLLERGDVVYWSEDGRWSEDLAKSQVFRSAGECEKALAQAEQDVEDRKILDPYLFVVEPTADEILPASVREKIRAKGPTVRLDLGKQAA